MERIRSAISQWLKRRSKKKEKSEWLSKPSNGFEKFLSIARNVNESLESKTIEISRWQISHLVIAINCFLVSKILDGDGRRHRKKSILRGKWAKIMTPFKYLSNIDVTAIFYELLHDKKKIKSEYPIKESGNKHDWAWAKRPGKINFLWLEKKQTLNDNRKQKMCAANDTRRVIKLTSWIARSKRENKGNDNLFIGLPRSICFIFTDNVNTCVKNQGKNQMDASQIWVATYCVHKMAPFYFCSQLTAVRNCVTISQWPKQSGILKRPAEFRLCEKTHPSLGRIVI